MLDLTRGAVPHHITSYVSFLPAFQLSSGLIRLSMKSEDIFWHSTLDVWYGILAAASAAVGFPRAIHHPRAGLLRGRWILWCQDRGLRRSRRTRYPLIEMRFRQLRWIKSRRRSRTAFGCG